jgi:hypothetical protein
LIDESRVRIVPKPGDSLLGLSKAQSSLIARGRKDAAALVTSPSAAPGEMANADRPSKICRRCGERNEPGPEKEDDGYCCWCRSREQEMSRIWANWGFNEDGQPLNGVWDEDAVCRDARAKLEIDKLLNDLGIETRWIDLRSGFEESFDDSPWRGTTQVWWIAHSINRKWGFDSKGEPLTELWDQDAKGRAAEALKELKKIVANLGFPILDSYTFGPLDCAEVCKVIYIPREISLNWTCYSCGETKELVFAGTICASCSFALDDRWGGSAATDWLLTRFQHFFGQLIVSEFVFLNTTYAQMKTRLAADYRKPANAGILRVRQPDGAEVGQSLERRGNLYPFHSTIRPATAQDVSACDERDRQWLIVREAAGIIRRTYFEFGMPAGQRWVLAEGLCCRAYVAERIAATLTQLGWLEEFVNMKRGDCRALKTLKESDPAGLLKMILQQLPD